MKGLITKEKSYIRFFMKSSKFYNLCDFQEKYDINEINNINAKNYMNYNKENPANNSNYIIKRISKEGKIFKVKAVVA